MAVHPSWVSRIPDSVHRALGVEMLLLLPEEKVEEDKTWFASSSKYYVCATARSQLKFKLETIRGFV
jgi:hypothetical protein